MTPRRRLALVGLLLVVGVGLCVAYAGADLWAYPTPDDVATDPAAADGQQVLVFGEVQSVDGETVVVTWGSAPEVQLTIKGVPPDVSERLQPTAAIQVYGQLSDDSTVLVADEVVVDYYDMGDRIYTYGTSILGGLVAAGVFLWYWRPNWRNLQFEPRGGR